MRGHKARRSTTRINKPCGANIQACPVGRGQRAIDNVTPAMTGFLHLDNLVFARVPDQRFRQPLPIGHGETKTQKKRRLASACGMPRVELKRVILASTSMRCEVL